MTDKNADVEWLRALFIGQEYPWPVLHPDVAHRLLAHIDQLEARLIEPFPQIPRAPEYRPTVHEIAAGNMHGLMARGTAGYASWQDAAVDCFDAAAALVAEGRTRDGV